MIRKKKAAQPIVDFEETPIKPGQAAKKTTIQKRNKRRKNTVKISNTKKTAIISVISTLLIIATIVGIFYGGMKFEQNRQHQIKAQATELAAELKAQK